MAKKEKFLGKTGTPWLDYYYNPWMGCTQISSGCINCPGKIFIENIHGFAKWGDNQLRKSGSKKKEEQIRDYKGKKIRIGNTMCDIFDEKINDKMRHDFFDLILQSNNITWVLQTKRTLKAYKFLNKHKNKYRKAFKKIWLGISCEDYETLINRKTHIVSMKILMPIIFVNIMPITEKIDHNFKEFDWVIITIPRDSRLTMLKPETIDYMCKKINRKTKVFINVPKKGAMNKEKLEIFEKFRMKLKLPEPRTVF